MRKPGGTPRGRRALTRRVLRSRQTALKKKGVVLASGRCFPRGIRAYSYSAVFSVPMTCDYCGRALFASRSDRRFCDATCRARWHARERRREEAAVWLEDDEQKAMEEQS